MGRICRRCCKKRRQGPKRIGLDAFPKINTELNFEYLLEREEKLKARETAKLEAEIVARERAEILARRRGINEEDRTKALAHQNLLEKKIRKSWLLI
ncbi:hypothetical protein KSP40_PGU021429 [Platanthera guangdongensis]|uniref:Uncharacterized protein n=1 Tax=Platanthera guangdongensis TaxID=2320717 RepID=A0ABR2M543_9ASPA